MDPAENMPISRNSANLALFSSVNKKWEIEGPFTQTQTSVKRLSVKFNNITYLTGYHFSPSNNIIYPVSANRVRVVTLTYRVRHSFLVALTGKILRLVIPICLLVSSNILFNSLESALLVNIIEFAAFPSMIHNSLDS